MLAPGEWQVGVFNPLRIGFDWVDIEVHPLVFLTAPHVDVKVPLTGAHPNRWQFTGQLGVSVPTLAWRLAKPFGFSGDLVPSCKVAEHDPSLSGWCQRPGWIVAPKFGLWATREFGVQGDNDGYSALTVRGEIATGIAVSGQAAAPLDAWGPVDVQFAPAVGRTRAQVRVAYDHLAASWLRLRGEIGGYWVSRIEGMDDLSPLTASVYAGFDLRTSAHTRMTAGAMYWNVDRHQRKVTTGADGYAQVAYVRSHEVWPTVDFIWSY